MSAHQWHPVGPTRAGDGVPSNPGVTPAPVVRPFSFTISRAMGTVVVTTHGVLDQDSARSLGDVLVDLIDHQGNLAVVIDVADLHLSDHMCVVPLATAASAAGRRGGVLSFADPSEAVERALTLTGLAGLVAMTTDGRPPSHAPLSAGAAGNASRRAAMAQHPAGSSAPLIAIDINTQGATQ